MRRRKQVEEMMESHVQVRSKHDEDGEESQGISGRLSGMVESSERQWA